MTVEDIKAAIEQLPEPERLELADWFDAMKNRAWDAEMERDFSPGGRGMRLLEEVEADIREGRVKPMQEFLAETKARRRSQSKAHSNRSQKCAK